METNSLSEHVDGYQTCIEDLPNCIVYLNYSHGTIKPEWSTHDSNSQIFRINLAKECLRDYQV